MWTRWSRLMWHNFVKVAGNWIKICSLALIGTCNRHAKFGLKIPNRLGKNARKPRGDFLSHTVYSRMFYVYTYNTTDILHRCLQKNPKRSHAFITQQFLHTQILKIIIIATSVTIRYYFLSDKLLTIYATKIIYNTATLISVELQPCRLLITCRHLLESQQTVNEHYTCAYTKH